MPASRIQPSTRSVAARASREKNSGESAGKLGMPRERVAALHDAPRVEHAAECTLGCVALDEVNSLAKPEFVARLGGVFEHSPWIAERAWHKRPFRTVEELHRAMLDAIATEDEKLRLARASGARRQRNAHASLLRRAGAPRFQRAFEGRARRNGRAQPQLPRKFGFPCIVALRLHAKRESVLAEMKRRLHNDRSTELANAMEQIGHITRARLEKIVDG